MSSIQLSLSQWNSQSQLLSLLSSLRPRMIRVRWVRHSQSLLRRILHSRLIQTKRQDRQSLPEWVSFTLRLSLIVFSVSSRLRQTLVHLRLLTRRHSQSQLISTASMLSSQVVVDSTVIVRLSSSLWILTVRRHSSSSQQLSVVLFLRSTSQQLERVSKRQLRLVSLAATQYLVFMLTYTMDHTMRSIHQRWHSTSLVLWHSRRLWLRLTQFFLSLS